MDKYLYLENINICTLKIFVYYKLQVKVTQISKHECDRLFDSTEKHICVQDADTPPAASSCRGDIGGPMMCGDCGHNVLAGVASILAPNCFPEAPSVYTRVSEYRDWIKEHTGV